MTNSPLIIIQARLDSSRLPRKTIALIDGIPSVVYQYRRVRCSTMANNIVVAIPDTQENDELQAILDNCNVPVYRGHPTNLLRRFIDCAHHYKSQTILRVNGDCPLISASTIDFTCAAYIHSPHAVYASTILDKTFPLGEHCECFDLNSLIYAEENLILTDQDCEHVTPILYNNPEIFTCVAVQHPHLGDYNQLIRLCIDFPEDLLFIRALLERTTNPSFDLIDLVQIIDNNPELLQINSHLFKGRTA